MKKTFKQIIGSIGVFALAIVLVNMSACGSKSDGGNPYQYGAYNLAGANTIGTYAGQFYDGSTLVLTLGVSPNGQVAAYGTLHLVPDPSCQIPPGTYQLQTVQPGQVAGQMIVNLTLQSNAGFPMIVQEAFLFPGNYVNLGGITAQRFMAITNMPGCPTNFN